MSDTDPLPSRFFPSRSFARLSLRLAVLLLLLVGCLTIPKLAPRMKQLFERREVKVRLAQRDAGRGEIPAGERVRGADAAWIAAAAAGGLLLLAPLGYFALRPRRAADSAGSERVEEP